VNEEFSRLGPVPTVSPAFAHELDGAHDLVAVAGGDQFPVTRLDRLYDGPPVGVGLDSLQWRQKTDRRATIDGIDQQFTKRA